MSLKKMLVIILVVVIAMFGLMLTTSYAWYSFEAGSTTFDAVTNNDDIEVTFLKGEYINNTVAVPISSTDVDQYSDKHLFSIRTKNNREDNEIMVTVSLVDIVLATELQNSSFKIDLYYQGTLITSQTGTSISTNTTKELESVVLAGDLDNQFELRVYLLDDDSDQTAMMGKTFQAKIQVDVVSRLKTTITDWSNPDIYVSSITIDGESSDYLPTEGLYTMESTCTKGSTLTWDGYNKTITYARGSYVNDSCSLTFTKSTDYMYLNEVEPGSYVDYIGTNGCDGKSCQGQNANYVSDMEMGYCRYSTSKFTVNGWRVAYIQDGSAYLVSAGAPECVATYVENKNLSAPTQTLSTNYYYGSGYTFDSNTGKYSLTGVTDSALEWSTNYESIIANTPYTCKSTSSTDTCTVIYRIFEYSSDTEGEAYPYGNYDVSGAPTHLKHLNQVALTYCNKEFANGGVCNESTAWAMNANDFKNITGKELSSSSCYAKSSDKSCGYTNDLIDNGGCYWYGSVYNESNLIFIWTEDRGIGYYTSDSHWGVRPILYLDSSVMVVGGSGTYEDPYQIQ